VAKRFGEGATWRSERLLSAAGQVVRLRVVPVMTARRAPKSGWREDPGPPAVPGQAFTAVVGSMTRFTSVILFAGKPLISACLRISASSFAM
jgi:hypothetical protein